MRILVLTDATVRRDHAFMVMLDDRTLMRPALRAAAGRDTCTGDLVRHLSDAFGQTAEGRDEIPPGGEKTTIVSGLDLDMT